jgi:hypothetical protein
MNKNLIPVLVFILIVFIIFWIMPDTKIEAIGKFLEKIIIPLCMAFGGINVIGSIDRFRKK